MDRYQERSLKEHVQAAVSSSLAEFFEIQEAQYRKHRDEDRKARKKGIKKVGDGWEERYPLVIQHFATIYGRDARVSIEGCDRSFHIYQNANRPLFKRNGMALSDKPQWHVRMMDMGDNGPTDTVLWEHSSENFESLLQQTIVMMMGHAFMASSI
jgi:hypothetical protein